MRYIFLTMKSLAQTAQDKKDFAKWARGKKSSRLTEPARSPYEQALSFCEMFKTMKFVICIAAKKNIETKKIKQKLI